MNSVKVSFRGDIRRFSIPEAARGVQSSSSTSYEQLVRTTCRLFCIAFDQQIYFRYCDPEGDFLVFSSEEEFQEALHITQQPLRLEACLPALSPHLNTAGTSNNARDAALIENQASYSLQQTGGFPPDHQPPSQRAGLTLSDLRESKRDIKERIRQLKKQKKEAKNNLYSISSDPLLFDKTKSSILCKEWREELLSTQQELQTLKIELRSLKFQRNSFRTAATGFHARKLVIRSLRETVCDASSSSSSGDDNDGDRQPLNARLISGYPELSIIPCKPLTSLQRQWKVRNEGPHAWPEGTCLVQGLMPLDHDLLQSPRKVPAPPLRPGESCDISVTLCAPHNIGIYHAVFRLSSPGGTKFGPRLPASIIVVPP